MRWSSAWGVPAAGEDGTLMVVGDGERWLGFIISSTLNCRGRGKQRIIINQVSSHDFIYFIHTSLLCNNICCIFPFFTKHYIIIF